MAQDFSFNMSEPFTPNATIDPTPTQDVSISFLSATSFECKTAQEICTSPDSCIFYTPECSSHNSELFIVPLSPLMNGDTVCSDVGPNYQQEKQYNDPLFSTNKTEFICNLNPPNSSFKIGASPTQIGKVTLLSIPHAPITKDNKLACVPISPMIPAKYRRNMARNIPTHHLQNTANKSNSSLQKHDTNPASNNKGMLLCQSPELTKKESLPNLKSPKLIQSSSFIRNKKQISRKVYKCQDCSNTYTLSTRYETHLLRHSKNMELFLCNICGQTFHTKRVYKVHTYKHEDTNATRKSTRNYVIGDVTMNNFPQTLSYSFFNNRKKIIPDRSTIHNISHIDTTVTPVQSSTNIPMKQNAVSSLHNSPITSTPFSIKLNKPKSKAKQRSEKVSNGPFSSPDLPEIGFKDEQTISLQNKTNSTEPTYSCDQCTKSFLSLRALKIHLSAHKKAGQFHEITKKPKRKLRTVFKKNSPCKLCDFDCSLQVNC